VIDLTPGWGARRSTSWFAGTRAIVGSSANVNDLTPGTGARPKTGVIQGYPRDPNVIGVAEPAALL